MADASLRLGLIASAFFFFFFHSIGFAELHDSQTDKPLWSCRNTVQGRALLADEHGYICGVRDIDRSSGCCPRVQEPFQCIDCNLTSKCCNSFEYCVTCCLNPNQISNELAKKVKIAQHMSAGTYKDAFDFCLGRCRHDSNSVVHENSYATEHHHCYALPQNSSSMCAAMRIFLTCIKYVDNSHISVSRDVQISVQGSTKMIENGLDNLSIVIGRLGQSCDTACKLNGQLCQRHKLEVINKCSVLYKYFNCRGACVASIDQPAEITPSAPRHMHPGACLLTTQESVLSCEGFNIHTRRLCPCA